MMEERHKIFRKSHRLKSFRFFLKDCCISSILFKVTIQDVVTRQVPYFYICLSIKITVSDSETTSNQYRYINTVKHNCLIVTQWNKLSNGVIKLSFMISHIMSNGQAVLTPFRASAAWPPRTTSPENSDFSCTRNGRLCIHNLP